MLFQLADVLPLAVIVAALKFPDASRLTILFTVGADVAPCSAPEDAVVWLKALFQLAYVPPIAVIVAALKLPDASRLTILFGVGADVAPCCAPEDAVE